MWAVGADGKVGRIVLTRCHRRVFWSAWLSDDGLIVERDGIEVM